MDYEDVNRIRRSKIRDLTEEDLELLLTIGVSGMSLTRIKILKILYSEGQLTAPDMVREIGVSQSAIYNHFNILQIHGLLVRTARDRWRLRYHDIPDYMKVPEMSRVFDKCEEISIKHYNLNKKLIEAKKAEAQPEPVIPPSEEDLASRITEIWSESGLKDKSPLTAKEIVENGFSGELPSFLNDCINTDLLGIQRISSVVSYIPNTKNSYLIQE